MTISLNHANVMREVNRLRTLARDLNTLQANARNALNNMNTYWEGAAANEFAAKNETWRREMQDIERELNSLADLIKRVADEIQAAEKRTKAAITSGSV
jgi:WXG100 family type VII secretion target